MNRKKKKEKDAPVQFLNRKRFESEKSSGRISRPFDKYLKFSAPSMYGAALVYRHINRKSRNVYSRNHKKIAAFWDCYFFLTILRYKFFILIPFFCEIVHN